MSVGLLEVRMSPITLDVNQNEEEKRYVGCTRGAVQTELYFMAPQQLQVNPLRAQ